MAKSGLLDRFAGKKFVFSGKFGYGVEDSLKAMAEAWGGKVLDDLDAEVDYLVLADATAGKTIQKKALTLNAKGAAVQVIDADAFRQLAEPTEAEVLELLRSGQSVTYSKLCPPVRHVTQGQTPKYTFHEENLSSVKLSNIQFHDIRFEACSFVGAELEGVVLLAGASDCDFSNAIVKKTAFHNVTRCKFRNAALQQGHFGGDFSGADFTGATAEGFTFSGHSVYWRGTKTWVADVSFAKANLKSATFRELQLKSPNFDNADLTGAVFQECVFESARLRGATLRDAGLIGCNLSDWDLTNADLTGANLAGANLKGAKLGGANLKNVNLRSTDLDGVDLSQVKNYEPAGAATGSAGPALQELDAVHAKAKRIQVTFRLRASSGDEEHEVGIDSSGLRYGWGIILPRSMHSPTLRGGGGGSRSFSSAMLTLAQVTGHLHVRFETVDVSSTKSPTGGKELRELVLRGVAEAFAQPLPPADQLAATSKEYRAAEREKGAAERERREQAKADAEKQKKKANKQLAKKIEKSVGKVNDAATFLKALELRIEKAKIEKATKMLKASRFKLFNDVTDEYVSGVVKSQTDPDLVYACRLAHDGQYACCTQNLNICGGLRGSACKHLLVLIIGLVRAGELDPTTIDAWIAKTHTVKPELDKDVMSEIFLKYKGAETGEIDWRPTETVPEDYYVL